MPIAVPCPYCGHVLDFGDQVGGLRRRCPACREPVILPRRSGPAAKAERVYLDTDAVLVTDVRLVLGVWAMMARHWGLVVRSAGGESQAMLGMDFDTLQTVEQAVSQAIIDRG